MRREAFSLVTGLALVALSSVGYAGAVATSCYIDAGGLPCCSIVGGPQSRSCGLLGHDCSDQITSNPFILRVQVVPRTLGGKESKDQTPIEAMCVWTPRTCKLVGCDTVSPVGTASCPPLETPSGEDCKKAGDPVPE